MASRRNGKSSFAAVLPGLESLGAEVWEPFEHNNLIDLSKPGWAYQVACADVRDVEQADGFFCDRQWNAPR